MLRNLDSRIKVVESYFKNLDSAKYHHQFDNDGNLEVVFKNKPKIVFPFLEFRIHQKKVFKLLFEDGWRFFYFWWPRRSGKEVLTWNTVITAAITQPGVYFMIYPDNVRARIILWDGAIMMPDGSSMLFRDMIPKNLILGKPNTTQMKIRLVNGSVIRVLGADVNPDKLRGTNPRGVVMSEYAYCDPRVRLILMPILQQNKGWLILQTTPNGYNHAHQFMQDMQNNPEFYTAIETAETLVDKEGNRYITEEMLKSEKDAGMAPWIIKQEYFCDVESNSEIFYFSKEMNYINKSGRVKDDFILTSNVVRSAFDIGWDDSTAVVQFQMRNGSPIIINYFEENNQAMEYYVTKCKEFCYDNNLHHGDFFFPHDGENKAWATGKNAVDVAQDLGINALVVKRPASHIMAIQSIRRLLPRTLFNRETTERLRLCLSNYQKEWDSKNKVYENRPLHNWSSHGTKAYQTMVLAIEGDMINETTQELSYYNPIN